MYNRYIPQPDGTYTRNRVPDKVRPHKPHPTVPEACPPPAQESCPPPTPEVCPPVQDIHPCSRPQRKETGRSGSDVHHASGSIGGFLRQLLPRDFDTGDLLIVVLLLLMAGDCAEEQNTALLTLALYMFM